MRLLRRDSHGGLSFAEFIGNNIPPYAILSHTWSQTSKEITFSAFISGEYARDAEYAESYEKIRKCGEQATRDGLEYFWVDTCCINKDSSAELSEAINSMYAWYRDADSCYAFLSDVHHKAEFHKSRWFTRGWTLQELIAPADIIFFDASWSTIGFKTSLIRTLSQHTGIDAQLLAGRAAPNRFSIAERMSWAASRQTTRLEDEAYCLMGMFEVNMPLIYGEGKRAFLRLQEELLKRSNDASIFAYVVRHDVLQSAPTESLGYGTAGLFATSPSFFQYSKDIVLRRWLTGPAHARHQRPSQIQRSGQYVKFYGMLWRPTSLDFPRRLSDTDTAHLQKRILKRYNIKLSLLSIRALCLFNQLHEERMNIAFLGCSRRDGGIIGIMLKENIGEHTYSRVHYPSIVETDSTWLACEVVHDAVLDEINIKADMIRDWDLLAYTKRPWALDTFTYRSTNFRDYGLVCHDHAPPSSYQIEYKATGNSEIPRIVLERNLDPSEEMSLVCTLFANTPNMYMGRSLEGTASKRILVPIGRRSSTKVELTEELQLTLRTHLQWRNWEERVYQRCLLILSIEEGRHRTHEDVLLEDDPDDLPQPWRFIANYDHSMALLARPQ